MRGLVLSVWLLLTASASAQTPPANVPPPIAVTDEARTAWGFVSRLTPYEFWLTLAIIAFGLINIMIVLFLFRKSVADHGETVLKYMIVISVITGSIVLVTAGYSNDQIAPAFGLFGTITGYILGRLSRPDEAAAAGGGGTAKPETPATGPVGTTPDTNTAAR